MMSFEEGQSWVTKQTGVILHMISLSDSRKGIAIRIFFLVQHKAKAVNVKGWGKEKGIY